MAKDMHITTDVRNGVTVLTAIPFPSHERGLIENLACALGVSTEMLLQPMPRSEQNYRADPAAVQAMHQFQLTLSQAAFEAWEAECIVYEDEHTGHVEPLRGRLLLPTRNSITWEPMRV